MKEKNTRQDQGQKADVENMGENNQQDSSHSSESPVLTYVKNAHASGLGSIGRNDEKASTSSKEDQQQSY